MLNRQGWAASLHDGVALIKRFGAVDGATYPDLGCNTELFTDGSMLELETLGPLRRMDSGESVEHVETWLFAAVECGGERGGSARDRATCGAAVQGLPGRGRGDDPQGDP